MNLPVQIPLLRSCPGRVDSATDLSGVCRSVWFRVCMAWLLATLVCGQTFADDELVKTAPSANDRLIERGKQIYAQSCVSCHGESGEGVSGSYDEPLIGDASVGELTRIVNDRMPEGEPDKCVGEDAEAVSAFIHFAFYSEAARLRNRPPRVMLTRLTGNQLRQSLADLYGHFTGSMWRVNERGINGVYYNTSRRNKENKKIERVDGVLDFDWQNEGPGEGIAGDDFSVFWRGGLKVDVTGEYEIVVRSSCAFILDLGRYDREFINNRVQSGDKTEFRKTVMLTAGRVYPIEMDLYQRKRKTEQPPARVSLSWIPPGGVEHIIPARHLLPASAPATFSLQTKLPPDDRSYGYERGLSVDRQWDESTTAAAVEFARIAVDELWPEYLRRQGKGSESPREALKTFLEDLIAVAFRGPLDDATRKFYIESQISRTEDNGEAITRSLIAALKSPRFLYPMLDRDRSVSQRVANRLALTMFDSLPSDQWLLDLVAANQLETEEQIRNAARKMVGDYRTRGKTRELMYEWLNLSHLGEITKNQEDFPEFDEQIVADLRDSLDAFLDEVVWSESSDYRQLFEADWTFTTERLKDYYGPGWEPAGEEPDRLVRSVSDAERRIGLLSHPYLMSGLAYQDSTSPIHRGVFLIRYMLGRTLRPPAEAFSPLSPDLHPGMTTRERVQLQTSPESCQICHSRINGLGFTLENYDAVGRFRQQEGEKSVDPTGQYMTRSGELVELNGPRELAEFLARSDDSHRAFVNRAFQHFAKQPIAAYGVDLEAKLTERFRDNGFRIRDLLVDVAVESALHPVREQDQNEQVQSN